MSRAFAFRLATAVLAFALAACAEMAPPPGGPPDLTAPVVASVTPDSLATGVDPATPFVVTFSEKVVKDRLPDWLFIRPFRRIDSIDWNGAVASITFRGGLPRDSTVSIEIGDGIADRHGNRLVKPFRRTFSTGAQVAPGVISGEVRRTHAAPAGPGPAGTGTGTGRTTAPAPPFPATASRTGPAAAAFVWAYRASGAADTIPDLAQVDPDYLTEVGPDGTFRLDGLPAGVPLRLFAIFDSDRSRTFTPGRDYASMVPEKILLVPEEPVVKDLVIFLIDPKAPGTVSGTLAARTDTAQVDTLSYGVLVSSIPEDTTAAPWPPLRAAKQSTVSKTGAFSVRGVSPGRYRAAAFIDFDRNGQWSRLEPLGEPVEVAVRPDEDTKVELPRPRLPAKSGP